jgi:hypothetical protein
VCERAHGVLAIRGQIGSNPLCRKTRSLFSTPRPRELISLVDMNLMNCRGGRRRRLDLDYAKSFASSKLPTSILAANSKGVRVRSPRPLPISFISLHLFWNLKPGRETLALVAHNHPDVASRAKCHELDTINPLCRPATPVARFPSAKPGTTRITPPVSEAARQQNSHQRWEDTC